MFPEVGVGLVTRVDCLHLPRVGHGVGVAPAELHLLPASLISVFCGAFNSIVTSCSQSVPLFGVCGVSAASSHLRLMRVGSACLAHHPTSGSYRLNKGLGAGLATIALAGVGAGVGIVFGSLIHSVSRNPTLSKQLFGYAILGFALSEAMALFALLVAFVILFGLPILGG